MPRGKVKKVIIDKGYGFIKPEDGGGDIFFHYSVLVGVEIEDLMPGQSVSYDVAPGQDGKGPRAVNIALEAG